MRRRLGGFESAEAWTGDAFAYNVVVVLRLAGRPRPRALEAALAKVQRRHPLLRARLARRGSRWSFVVEDSAPIPLREVERGGEEEWRSVVEEEVGLAMEAATAPLARCVLLASSSDDSASELILSFHHAIADATSGSTVCRQVLELCGGVTEEVGESTELPPPPEERFPARFRGLSLFPRLAAFLGRQMVDEVGYLWRSRGVRSPPPGGPVRCRVLPMAMSEASTRALVRSCRRRRVPISCAVNGALLLELQRRRYAGRAVPLRYFAFPNLRPHLEPPMPPELVASHLVTMRFTRYLGLAEPFWELARGLNEQQYRAFKRGEKFLFCLTAAGLLRMLIRLGRLRFGSAAISYTGPLDLPARFGSLGVRGVHAFVSNFEIGPEFSAQVRLFRGRLWWDFLYLDAEMDESAALALATGTLRRLEEAADERD